MPLLLIDEEGSTLRREDEHFVVSEKALDLLTVRPAEIDVIVLAGRVEITRAAINLAASRDIPVFLTSGNGRMQGSVLPPMSNKPNLRENQYATFNDASCCTLFSRLSISAQIANQRALLRQLAIDRDAPALLAARAELKQLQKSLVRYQEPNPLRGVEGAATRTFYEGIRSILDPSLGFTLRAVRSDKDPFNCCLDVLGGLLAQTCKGAIEIAGLDPFKGALHGSSRNAPALALDLEDVYRPLLVMAVAVSTFTKKVLKQKDFVAKDRKCSLTKTGFTKLVRQFGKKLHREVTRNKDATPKSYLEHVFIDAGQIAQWVENTTDEPMFLTVK